MGEHRFVRAGAFAWSIVGLLLVLWALLYVLDTFRLIVVPLMLALFPAAILSPLSSWLKRRGWRPALVAAVLVVGTLLVTIGLVVLLAWLIADEIPAVIEALREAYADIRAWIQGRFDVTIPEIDELLDQARQWAAGQDIQATGREFAVTTLEVLSGILLALVALFFYLKDGERIAGFARQLVPVRLRQDATEIGDRVWATLGGYFRGQLTVAAVDAFFIGLGLVLLGVPLALPLAVLVFIGGLFPIVGAFTAGAVAVLIALADGGIGIALAVLALNVVVQQAEGNLLEPLIVGRATKLHPLAVLAALTSGAVTLGILGAFLAVPVTASIVRAVGYAVERHPDVGSSRGSAAAFEEPDEIGEGVGAGEAGRAGGSAGEGAAQPDRGP